VSRPGAALDAHVVVAHAGLDVRLAAEPGAVLAVMGPSGSGKTTLLEAIAGLTRLDGGAIVLGDTELAGPSRHLSPSHRSVGLLGQDALLFPHLSAAQNIGFAARIAGADRARARAVAADWLDRIGLAGLGGRAPHQLSAGQRQRVALARALAAAPRLLLLDEPFAALDVQAAAALRDTVADQLRGTTTILVSHGVADAAALADRLVLLEHGRITQQGPVAEVLAAPATDFGAALALSLAPLAGRG
jgi:ABC-type sulfate/molybdate transport systems ATPase subunit